MRFELIDRAKKDFPVQRLSITVAIFAGALLGLRPDVLVATVTRR